MGHGGGDGPQSLLDNILTIYLVSDVVLTSHLLMISAPESCPHSGAVHSSGEKYLSTGESVKTQGTAGADLRLPEEREDHCLTSPSLPPASRRYNLPWDWSD